MNRGVKRKRKFFRKDTLLLFGPAWLVMMADMDASSYIGAAQTGATLGYSLIWVMILLIFPLYIILELAGRISIATGEGLGNVARKNYGIKISSLLALPMAITDMLTYGIEYLGIGIGFEIMGLSLYYTIPVIYVTHLFIVIRKKYDGAEKPMIMISLILIASMLISLWNRGVKPFSSPLFNPFLMEPTAAYFFLIAANVGAVIMPFMIFFQASAIGTKMKGIQSRGFKIDRQRAVQIMRKETFAGAVVTELLMIIVEMAFTGIPRASNSSFFSTPSQLGKVLIPIAGTFSPYILGVGIIAAGFIALITISLGSAWGISESLNIPKRSQWIVYLIESTPAVLAVMVINPGALIISVLYLLIFFVFALIAPMLMLWIIGRNRKIMGDLTLSRGNEALFLFMCFILVSIAILATLT
ncbi:MAG: NRAMP family divalent metal transporter [Cuniculiplasma sp.]